MGFFSNLIKALGAGDPPESDLADPRLGTMRWSDDDEAWLGEYNGHPFSIAYERSCRPAPELMEYARSMLDDGPYLSASFERALEDAKVEMGSYAAEIDGLRLGRLHFFQKKGTPGIFGDLDGGRDYRAWRIEYTGRTCHGIGFDS